jgi:hypothetical protein
MSDPIHWPDSLDPTGKGYTRRMGMHLNFGDAGGTATAKYGKASSITLHYATGEAAEAAFVAITDALDGAKEPK